MRIITGNAIPSRIPADFFVEIDIIPWAVVLAIPGKANLPEVAPVGTKGNSQEDAAMSY